MDRGQNLSQTVEAAVFAVLNGQSGFQKQIKCFAPFVDEMTGSKDASTKNHFFYVYTVSTETNAEHALHLNSTFAQALLSLRL